METVLPATIERISSQVHNLEQIAKQPVVDQYTYDIATDALRFTKGTLREIDEAYDASIKAAHDAHKAVLAAKAKYADPLKAAEKQIKANLTSYVQEQDRLRREAEQKAREEQMRLQQEEEARIKANQQEQAAMLDALGLPELASEIASAPVSVQVAAPEIAVPEVVTNGIQYRDNWTFRIIDPALIPREYLMIDEKKIGQVVRAMKDLTNIPGVQVQNEKTAVVR